MRLRLWQMLLAPGNPFGEGGGGAPAPAPAPAPASTPAPTPEPSGLDRGSVSSPASQAIRDFDTSFDGLSGGNEPAPTQSQHALPTPTDPNQAAGAGTPQNFQSIRDAAGEYGYQFGQDVTDDRQALMHLIQQANNGRMSQQQQYYAQVGQTLAPHAQKFQQYLQHQQAPQVQATPNAWEAPEFDRRWVSLVVQDPASGVWISKPGVDPTYGQKVNAFVEWKERFDANPAEVLNGMVEARATTVAEQIYQKQFAANTERQTAQGVIERNRPWLYQQDQNGSPLRDQWNRPVPTPMGAAYIRHIATVKQMGVSGAAAQDHLARQLLAGELANARYQQSQQAVQQAAPATQQAIARPNVNPLQALSPQQRAANPAATQPNEDGLSLYERLNRNFVAAGITDNDFSPENFSS